MNVPITEASPAQLPKGPAMRFTYPGGSRPLEGFTIKRGVGRGGFGEVYYATSDAGKEVALKLVRRNLEIEVRGVSQCLNLKHPNLISLYDIKRDQQDDTWVVMEYVAGESLEDVVSRNPQGMPVDEALAWLQGMAAGVAYLHDRGIVHRDLKPGNVFNDDGCVKIGDYGLSKFISASRRSGQTESVGTVHYMAPEVANGRYGKEIDVYALGVMLYEMLTGHVPFEGESVGEVLMKHLTAQPDLTRLAEPFRSVVARALEKDPEKRIRTVTELAAQLPAAPQPLRASRPAEAPPVAETMAWARGGAGFASPQAAPVEAVLASPAAAGADWLTDEPIWRFVRSSWSDVARAWHDAPLNAPLRLILVGLFLLAFLTLSGVWITALILYGIYFGARVAWLSVVHPQGNHAARVAQPAPVPSPPRSPATAPNPVPVAAGAAAVPPPLPGVRLSAGQTRRLRWKWSLPAQTPREQFTELLGSMLTAAAVCTAVAAILAIWIAPGDLHRSVWTGLVSTLGAWCVLIPSRIWAGRPEEMLLRRLVMLGFGLCLGLAAYGLDRTLFVDLSGPARINLRDFPGVNGGDAWGRPTLTDYLAYFGFLMPVLRWWRSADPRRRMRFSLGPPIVGALWAMVLSWFWTFPQPWGMIVAASMSTATQLASPWMERNQHEAAWQQAA